MSKRLNYLKKFLKILLIIVITYFILGPYDYRCYRCDAYKYWFLTSETKISKWLTAVTKKKCNHQWILNSYLIGLLDRFVILNIPLSRVPDNTCEFLDSMPHEVWKESIINALRDEKNRLRWAIVIVLTEELYKNPPTKSRDQWILWNKIFESLFYSEHRKEEARQKWKEVLVIIKREYKLHASSSLYSRLFKDLEFTQSEIELVQREISEY